MADQEYLVNVFHFDEDRGSFEDRGKTNGFRHWMGRELQEYLGYSSWSSFSQVINKAITACMTLKIPVPENFEQSAFTDKRGRDIEDYKLSKFACYLVAMNGDVKNPNVARAQAYFAVVAEAFQKYIQNAEDVERVEIRSQVSEREKGLASVAKNHGVENYAFFQNAGYRGMYNMTLRDLKNHKGIMGKATLLDFMGKRELAANLFRLTETEAKVENENVRGQRPLESAAESVGRDVRSIMLKQGGRTPEDLPLAPDIKRIHTDLRKTHRKLAKPGDEK